jgi:hypothetical protein
VENFLEKVDLLRGDINVPNLLPKVRRVEGIVLEDSMILIHIFSI